ncbi:SH3 domain-containing protein 19 isoform X2 [Hypomesus transpacificus]|uniref:SH3 domain-containing protein 19 isoform X2 n=1 Tax=Hypomesus transpacificus TaxID=137520 RepID=UPI001F07920E|nr:SH3 domain-containing protein 19 isoform X2 [Hypomesus transpacificus]
MPGIFISVECRPFSKGEVIVYGCCSQGCQDRSERNKPEHLISSQGPLSSIRAAIKRTRSVSQSDHARDRRRPEITILSAEPLASNTWFPATSGAFTSPPTQPVWTGALQNSTQPPPSYDQVIKEKTQEHVATPITARRQSTTISTQTDPAEEDTTVTATPEQTEASLPIKKNSTGQKPLKPPRPSPPKPLRCDLTCETQGCGDTKVNSTQTASITTGSQSKTESAVVPPSLPDSCINTHTPSVSVSFETSNKPSEPVSTQADSPAISSQHPVLSSAEPVLAKRPTPLPRLKSLKQPIPEEVKVQTLVRLSDNGECTQVTPIAKTDCSSNKYLQELLEVFCADGLCGQSCDSSDQSDESDQGDMSALHSQRNIRARIQAFESQASTDEGTEGEAAQEYPEPRPRNAHLKAPPVATKPAMVPRASIKTLRDDTQGTTNNHQGAVSSFMAAKPALAPRTSIKSPFFDSVPSTILQPTVFTQAPRPLLPRKPSVDLPSKEESETPPTKIAVFPPSLPSVAARAKAFYSQEEVQALVPLTPRKEPLNFNNHNSTFLSMETNSENDYVESPTTNTPVKPVRSAGSFTRESITRRPTTIRVPSLNGSVKLSEDSPDFPPPLPVQKPVGSLPPPIPNRQSFTPSPITRLPSQNSFSFGQEPSFPPRPTGGKVSPPRPPPAKAGPGRPPPPRLDKTGRAPSTHGAPGGSPSPKQPRIQAQMPKRKVPILPPRPKPGHHLYNKYTLELPHGITQFDYEAKNPDELSFRRNEVLLLLEQVDHNTFECQTGELRGRVPKCHLQIITPLAHSVPTQATPQEVSPVQRNNPGMQVQVLHDFTPEGPSELGLRAGDVVTVVEQVDSDWYRGTCRGSSGFFPVSYAKVLSNASVPTDVRKAKPPAATVSGPRCVARFDFEGEHNDELTFSEGDVIRLLGYMGEEWARGQVGSCSGIFPIDYVDVIEDLPPPPATQQQSQPFKMALPGMTAPAKTQEAAKPVQSLSSGSQWAVALYDFAGQTEEELSFHQGERILVLQHIDADWSSGRLGGREGVFPRAFVETSSSDLSPEMGRQPSGLGRAKALFNFQSNCEEELSIQVGDMIANLESVNDEWFLGDLRGKRALVPKNYVAVLVEP